MKPLKYEDSGIYRIRDLGFPGRRAVLFVPPQSSALVPPQSSALVPPQGAPPVVVGHWPPKWTPEQLEEKRKELEAHADQWLDESVETRARLDQACRPGNVGRSMDVSELFPEEP